MCLIYPSASANFAFAPLTSLLTSALKLDNKSFCVFIQLFTFFTEKVLPQMVDYFSKIEIINGKAATTTLKLEELN